MDGLVVPIIPQDTNLVNYNTTDYFSRNCRFLQCEKSAYSRKYLIKYCIDYHTFSALIDITCMKLYKKLCYGRGTTRRACQYRKKLAIDEWPWRTPKVITQFLLLNDHTPYHFMFVQRLYLGPFSRHYHFWSERDCLWPWELLHFWQRGLNYKPRALSLICKHIIAKSRFSYELQVLQGFQTTKVTKLTQGHQQSCHSIARIRYAIYLPL